MAQIPFVGPSYQLDSRPASVQRTINLIPVPQEPGNERTSWVFKDVPGLVAVENAVVVKIGWLNPGTSDGGTAAHSNSGTGELSAFAGTDSVTELYAGVVAYTGQTVVWSSSWTPTSGGPAPVLDEVGVTAGNVRVTWQNQNGDPVPFLNSGALGSLILTATINGVPIAVGDRLVAVATTGGDYPDVAWGPEP